MLKNKLKLNDSKTEVLYLSSARRESYLAGKSIRIGQSDVAPSPSVRDLGARLDRHLQMTGHITTLVRKAAMGLRYISKLRRYLDMAATERLVHAFVPTHLDTYNSLLLALPAYQIRKLQRIQNAAARIVSRCRYRDHITPVMYSLHWLPIPARIEYKVLLSVFKCLNNLAPVYLANMLHIRQQNRSLRSSNYLQLFEPRYHTETYGTRAFSVSAPRMWNRLPGAIRDISTIGMFKTALKTFLFNKSYNLN